LPVFDNDGTLWPEQPIYTEVAFAMERLRGAAKPAAVLERMGRRPIAAFGNSDGHYEMLQYTTTGPGRRLGIILHHDDADREYAYDRESDVGRLDRGLLLDAQADGW
jgi:hypothetical protein